MQYQEFPISDFRHGKVRGKAPWLQPSDAFPVLQNARVNLGVLEKRNGYTLLATTGAGLPIMGIFEARYQGVPKTLVLDTKRLYVYDIIADTLTDISGGDVYSGEDYDYFKFVTLFDKTFFCNGVNGIDYWDDSTDTVSDLDTAAGAGTVAITTCRGMFVLKSRVHFVQPTIGGVFYSDRIYHSDVWSGSGAPIITNSTQWYTYERDDVPVAYHPLDMEAVLIMGRKSSWRVVYTGSSSTPFTCKTLDTVHGCTAPHVAIEYNNPTAGRLIATLSNTHLVACDGSRWHKIDWPIRDLPAEMAARYLYYAQGSRLTEREAFYLTYPDADDTYPTNILEYNSNENNWATHSLSMHCLAGISGEVLTADYSLRAGMIARAAQGYTYGGDRNGNLFRLDYGTSDNGANIAMEVRSAALNPFHAEGRKAYLSWIYLYLDHDANASFTFYLYKDDQDTPYLTRSVSCDAGGARFWQRVNVGGEVGDFHQMRIANDATNNRPRIHAICPWFARGGRMSPNSDASATWPSMTWRLHAEGGALYVQRLESGVWTNYTTWG